MSEGPKREKNSLKRWERYVLAAIPAIAVVVVAVVQGSGGSSSSTDLVVPTTPTITPTNPTGTSTGGQEGTESEGTEPPGSDVDGGEGAEGAPPPETVRTGDGSSRMDPKLLKPGRQRLESISAGNDIDWFVYEVKEDQTATIEVVRGESSEDSAGGVWVEVWDGGDWVNEGGAYPDEPWEFPHQATRGIPLYLKTFDQCESCAIGPYSIVVNSAPPD